MLMEKHYAIIGNPNLGEVRGMLLGVQNAKYAKLYAQKSGIMNCAFEIDEKGGWAALGSVILNLADLGNVNFTGNVRSQWLWYTGTKSE